LLPSCRNDCAVRPQGLFLAGVRAQMTCRNKPLGRYPPGFPHRPRPPKRTLPMEAVGLCRCLVASRHQDTGVGLTTGRYFAAGRSRQTLRRALVRPTPYRVFHSSCMPPARHRGSLHGVLPAYKVCAQLKAVPCTEAPVVPLMGIRPTFAVCACGMVHLAMDAAHDLRAPSLLAHSPRWSSACASRKLSTRLSSWCQPPWRFWPTALAFARTRLLAQQRSSVASRPVTSGLLFRAFPARCHHRAFAPWALRGVSHTLEGYLQRASVAVPLPADS